MKGEHPIRALCEALGVAPSGYYRWLRAEPSAREQEDAILQVKIALVHRQSRGNYGAPRVVAEIRAQGTKMSRRRCARLMRAAGLQGRKRHRRRPRTTDSSHVRPVAPNRLASRPAPMGPNQTWVTDITYIRTAEGWLYLAAILDAWSRRVVGWACSATLHTSVVLAALERAIQARRPAIGLLHHSDRGVQYACEDYARSLAAAGFEPSLSRAANC